jgi:hypothetical protein
LQLVLGTCCQRKLSQGAHSGAQKPLKQFVEKKYHSQQQKQQQQQQQLSDMGFSQSFENGQYVV